jgi:hypothetical protein
MKINGGSNNQPNNAKKHAVCDSGLHPDEKPHLLLQREHMKNMKNQQQTNTIDHDARNNKQQNTPSNKSRPTPIELWFAGSG